MVFYGKQERQQKQGIEEWGNGTQGRTVYVPLYRQQDRAEENHLRKGLAGTPGKGKIRPV